MYFLGCNDMENLVGKHVKQNTAIERSKKKTQKCHISLSYHVDYLY